MFKSYLILGNKGVLKRKSSKMAYNKEEAINTLYKEGATMARVLSQDVYLCVKDLTTGRKTIYSISKRGGIEQAHVVT
ncbi:MAG: hypothetical protein GY793_11990 [Proteobacteria bacterium]|nr:hypothetical protein [Pseudomonadota bacterium]